MQFNNFLPVIDSDLRLVDTGPFLHQLIKGKKVYAKQIAKNIGIPYDTFKGYLMNRRYIPIRVYINVIKQISRNSNEYNLFLTNLYQVANKITSISSKAAVFNLPKRLDECLAYLIGAIHDGTVFKNPSKNQYVIQYWQYGNKEWLTLLSNLLEQVFGVRPKEYKQYIQLSGKPVVEIFNKVLGVPSDQSKWNSFLIGIPWKYQKIMIAGMFDAEGWCGKNYDMRLKFTQKNLNKIKELKTVFEKRGIKCGSVIKDRAAFAIFICGQNCLRFYNQIGIYCRNKKKLQQLKLLVGDPDQKAS